MSGEGFGDDQTGVKDRGRERRVGNGETGVGGYGGIGDQERRIKGVGTVEDPLVRKSPIGSGPWLGKGHGSTTMS